MLKKKFALVLVMLMVFSTFTIAFGEEVFDPETVEVKLPAKVIVSDGNDDEIFEDWPLELYQKMDKKYMLIGIWESGRELELPEGMYKVKEMKHDGFYPYGPDAFEFEVYEDEEELVFEYDVDELDIGVAPEFQNVGPFDMVEGFWAMPGEWDEDEFAGTNGFEFFGKSWGGYFDFTTDEFSLKTGDRIEVGTVEFTTSTATFDIIAETTTPTMSYQLLEYQIHFFEEGEMEEKPFKLHDDGEYSVSVGHFNNKSDGFVGFDELEFDVAYDGELLVAVHGEIGVPFEGDFEFDFGVVFGEVDPEDEGEIDIPEGFEEVDDWKEEIAPSERGNKLGIWKKEDPDFYDFLKELDKKGGAWKKFKVED